MADEQAQPVEPLLIALRLYMRLPLGRLHHRHAEIIELAPKIGRTPNALVMKACDFARLDPKQTARSLAGRAKTSRAGREISARPPFT